MQDITVASLNKKTWSLSFIIYFVIFTVLDRLNMPYLEMKEQFGIGLVVINIVLNSVMAIFGSYLIVLNEKMTEIKGIKGKGENMSLLAIIFGVLTYGCTPCVISFFASVGIVFSVAVLPYAGLPYKLISLPLIIIGIIWTHFEIKQKNCNIKLKKEN